MQCKGEKSEKQNTVSQVEAIDADSGDNGDVTYSLMDGGEGKFRVNRKSGLVVLRTELGREDQNKEYVLIIRAQDSGLTSIPWVYSLALTCTLFIGVCLCLLF